MKYKFFSAGVVQIPFHHRRLINFIFIGLLVGGFTVSARANDDAQKNDSEDPRQLLKQAQKFTRRGETEEAEKILRRVVKINPQESKAKLALAAVLLKKRQLSEAYDISSEVAANEPKNADAYAVLGMVLLSAGNFSNAKTAFINALHFDQRKALAWAGMGTLNFYENRISDSLTNLRAAVYCDPNEPDFLFILAQVAARAENYTEAAETYEKFLQISPQTDAERRERIKGLINFLHFLGLKASLYNFSGGSGETVVSFNLINNRPIIQIKVNNVDEPLNFVLDTGSGVSVISKETAQKLKIKPITSGGLARAIGGDGKFEIVYGFLKNISIGEINIKNVPVYIREFHTKDDQIDGYIGLSLISKFLTTVDYGNSTFSLKRKTPLENQDSAGELLSLPLRLTSSGFLSGEVQLQGIDAPLNFIVDTGASVSVISDVIANSKEISPFVADSKMRVIGAAGITNDVPTFLLPRVTFGTHSRESITAVALNLDIINEASGFEQAGILGGNFLKNYRLTFDFTNSKVIFVPVK